MRFYNNSSSSMRNLAQRSIILTLHRPKRKMRQNYYKNIIIMLFIFSIGVNDRI